MTDEEISPTLLLRLVRAGNDPDVERALRESFPENERASDGSIMRLSPAPWTASASTLSRDELAALVRALTVAEVILDGWTAGSVSPVIWTFRVFQLKFADQADVLADWVLSRTVNQYLPYGRHNFGARSRSELSLLRKASEERRKAVHDKELQRQRDAQSRRTEKATRDLYGAIRRRDLKATTALLLKGANPRSPNEAGLTPFDLSREIGASEITALFDSVGNSGGDENATRSLIAPVGFDLAVSTPP
jgi:hypothetical protein